MHSHQDIRLAGPLDRGKLRPDLVDLVSPLAGEITRLADEQLPIGVYEGHELVIWSSRPTGCDLRQRLLGPQRMRIILPRSTWYQIEKVEQGEVRVIPYGQDIEAQGEGAPGEQRNLRLGAGIPGIQVQATCIGVHPNG